MGYKTVKSEKVKTIGSEVTELVHEKSGATIVLIKNKDEAKSFMVGFRTPPYDDSGLFHIFEHAVLEGSRLYPSKSNFFHLANSSVASFINAMTGSVYTLYPYVSKSTKDFDNLLSVYMDAVFFPNVLNDPRIIKREGWRYEVSKDKKNMSINGIVLSEMKGAFSSPYRSLWFELSRALVPDTPYSYSSGGLPSKIAGLTFDQIKDAHKKYYHPQNSVIYLYGDVEFEKALNTIDKDFLSHFTKTEDYKRPEIPVQKDFNYPTPLISGSYPGKDEPNKDYLSKGFVLGSELSTIEETVAHVLAQAFSENSASPLKLRIQKEGLAKNTFYMTAGDQDNAFAFTFEGANAESKEKIEKILTEEINKVVADGLDPELLTSILNKYEFSYKEKNSNGTHKGMQLGSIVLDNWIYKDEPLSSALDFVTHFKLVREKLNDAKFVKNFFKKSFQDNSKVRWVVLKPDPQFSKNFNAGLDKQVEEALKAKSIEEYAKEDAIYQKWVAEKESQEVLSKTPTLKLSDIKDDEAPTPYTQEDLGKTKVLKFTQDTSGISYVSLYFDLQGVNEENLKNLKILTNLLRKTDAGKLGFKDLSKEIDTYIGGLSIYTNTYESLNDPSQYKPTMVVSMKFLDDNKEKAFKLLSTILGKSTFSPQDRVDNLISELKTGMASSVSSRAPSLSHLAAIKSFKPEKGAFLDETSGAIFENHMLNSDLKAETLVPQLKNLLTQVFNQERLYLTSLTATSTNMSSLTKSVNTLKSELPKVDSPQQSWSFSKQKNYDAFAIPGEVQYVAQVTSYKESNLEYNGAMNVYTRYLNNHYMTPKLREQAGAYGGGSSFNRSGQFSMTTYRDPNLKRSFEIFDKAIDFMSSEQLSEDKLLPAILGSLKPYYKDKSIVDKASTMTNMFLTGQTWDDYLKIKKEVIATTPEDLKKISQALKEALKSSKKSVSGNPNKIKAEAPFLKNVLSLQ